MSQHAGYWEYSIPSYGTHVMQPPPMMGPHRYHEGYVPMTDAYRMVIPPPPPPPPLAAPASFRLSSLLNNDEAMENRASIGSRKSLSSGDERGLKSGKIRKFGEEGDALTQAKADTQRDVEGVPKKRKMKKEKVEKEPSVASGASSSDERDQQLEEEKGSGAVRDGRWRPDEHQRFLKGFAEFGNQWKRVQQVVGTRTVTQVRTHAQKHLLKLQKLQRTDTDRDDGRGGFDSSSSEFVDAHKGSHHQQVDQIKKKSKHSTEVATHSVSRPSELSDAERELIAAQALCGLLNASFDASSLGKSLKKTTKSKDASSSSPLTSKKNIKQYVCRACGLPKKGHNCFVSSQAGDAMENSADESGPATSG